MAIITYNYEDIVPITLSVLSVSTRGCLNTAFKFALKYYYQDLEGLVDINDDLDEESLKLLESLDDKTIRVILSIVPDFLQAYVDIRYTNLYHSAEKLLNERQIKLGVEFYDQLIIDFFPGSATEPIPDIIDENSYNENLLVYIESLISIVHMLQELILTGQLDTDEAIRLFNKRRQWGQGNHSDDLNSIVLRVLKELAKSLYEHSSSYRRYYYGRNS